MKMNGLLGDGIMVLTEKNCAPTACNGHGRQLSEPHTIIISLTLSPMVKKSYVTVDIVNCKIGEV